MAIFLSMQWALTTPYKQYGLKWLTLLLRFFSNSSDFNYKKYLPIHNKPVKLHNFLILQNQATSGFLKNSWIPVGKASGPLHLLFLDSYTKYTVVISLNPYEFYWPKKTLTFQIMQHVCSAYYAPIIVKNIHLGLCPIRMFVHKYYNLLKSFLK